MANKKTTIAAEIQVNTKYSGKTIGELKEEMKDLKKEIDKTTKGSDEFNRLNTEIDQLSGYLNGTTKAAAGSVKELKELKAQLKLTAAGSAEFKELSARIRDVEDGIENAKAGANDFAGALENADGPVGMLGKGIRQLEIATSSWSAALKATGIGLLVGLVGGLAAAFAKNEGAMKKLEPIATQFGRILNGILGAMQPLIDGFINLATKAMPYVSKAFEVAYSTLSAFLQSLGKVGEAVGKILKGDFAGAWQSAKSSVTDFKKNYDEAQKGFISGTKQLTDKEKEELEKRNQARKEALEKQKRLNDEKIAEEERLYNEQLKKEVEYYEKRQKKLKSLNTEIIGIDGLTDTERKKKKEDDAEMEKKQQDLLVSMNKDGLGKKLADTAKAYTDQQKLDEQFNNAQLQADRDLQNAKFDIAQAGLNILGSLAAGNEQLANTIFLVDKALAIAKIVVNTQGEISGYALANSIYGPAGIALTAAQAAAAKIRAGVGIATIIATTIAKYKGGAGGAGSGLGSLGIGSSPSAPLSPQASVTTLNQAQVNQIGNIAAKAYVVESDVTGNQERIRRLNRAARIS
jgi:hypothetical protein